ncbi:MAG: UvrD-helicase domain-containing protein, partial [Clostridia bacterium]
GFCTEVLRQHFQAVGIDPSFRIADGAEMEALRAQAMDAALLACYERPSAAFDTLSNALTPAQILQWAAYVERFMMARPDPWTWLAQSVDALRVTPEEISTCTWMRTILQFVALDAQGACNQFEQLAQICAQTEGLVRYRETAQADVKMARTIIQSAEEGYDALQACTLCFARRPAKKKDEDPNLLALFDQYRDRGKKLLKNAIHAAWLFRPVQEHALDLEDAHTLLSGVVDVLKAFAKRFEAMKREKNLLSFQDLEHLALHALQTPYVAAYYHRKYEYVFVDEYQDSSALQEAILQCFVPGNHFFMVGDVKQSIYRFRLADPMLFLSKYTSYATDAQAEARRIDLNANFRSSPMVLAAVNDLFRDIMRADITEIAYDADAMLYPGRVFASEQPRVELHLLADNLTDADEAEAEDEPASDFEVITSDLPAVEEEEEGIEGDDRLVYEAEVIAERIYALQAQKATGLNGEPLRLSDMVILLRATTRRVTPILETLQRHGIPAWADGGDGYFEQLEIRQMIDLLSVIDNPYQDLPFLSALRGPALGLHEEELAEIRIEQPDGDFYAATCQRAKRQDPLGISLQAFFARLERWRFLSRIVPLSIFVQEVFQEMDLYATAGALPNGRARQMNLRRLVMRAGRFERQQMGGLSKFLRHLTRIRQGESMAAHELGDAEEIVRIMSIHKSKGLQFPVVFVAGLGNSFNQRVKSAPLLAHSALGIGAMAYDPEVPARYQTLARRAIALRTYQEQLAEETRILYVAMTRAEKYLILVGCGDALEKDCMRWSFPISAASVYQARHMLDWVAHSLMHRPAGNVLREIAQLTRLPEDPNDPWQVILHPRR